VRLFVAVDVDRETRAAASRLRDRLARERPPSARELRWVAADLLHLTVRFLGERDDLTMLTRALGETLPQTRFRLTWSTPPRGRPRVLYVAVADGLDALRRVAGEVDGRLAAAGIAPDDRPFTGHLTLARVRDGAGPALLADVGRAAAGPFAPGTVVEVGSVVLYESRLSPRGPTYHERHRVSLS
jgi:2'-5' RNA ligase